MKVGSGTVPLTASSYALVAPSRKAFSDSHISLTLNRGRPPELDALGAFSEEMITDDVAIYIDSSVLCWLATVSEDGLPNVSPKEAFLLDEQGRILVANIASPQTVRNILGNENVCLSFVNVFVQRGYKVRGKANILKEGDARHAEGLERLTSFIGDTFKIVSIIEIDPVQIDPVIAPSYVVFPDSTEQDRICESLETYSVADYQKQAEPGEAE